MNIGFVMYPWDTIKIAEDSTLRMVHEAVKRGHKVAIIYHDSFTIDEDTHVYALCDVVVQQERTPVSMQAFHKNVKFKQEFLPLRGFDVLFLRSNPPIDPIMLNFLDSIKDDVFIMNDVDGLRKASTKIYPATLDDPNHEIIPRTVISKNKKYLKQVINEAKSDKIIMKPLDGYGGSGVIILEKSAKKNINSLLEFYIDREGPNSKYVILQEYVEGAEQGDIRVLMLNGKVLGCMRRVPAKDDARSNVHAGGSVVKHTLTKAEKKVCEKIGPQLVKDGLYFVGLDLIGGKLIEVNVVSPGGIPWINKNNRTNIQAKVMDFAESVVLAREAAMKRREQMRKRISDV